MNSDRGFYLLVAALIVATFAIVRFTNQRYVFTNVGQRNYVLDTWTGTMSSTAGTHEFGAK